MNRTKIDWPFSDLFTVNPFIGCSHASAGCEHCYAEAMAKRLAEMGNEGYKRVEAWDGSTLFLPQTLDAVRSRKKPCSIFWCSMSDLFHENNRFEDIHRVWAVMVAQSSMTHVVLTKRPQRMKEFIEWLAIEVDALKSNIPLPCDAVQNLWLGVTAENQEMADERIPILLSIKGQHKRFVSVEPMLEGIDLLAWFEPHLTWESSRSIQPHGLDLVIIGAETGAGARPCKREWIDAIVEQCNEAKVEAFCKENTGRCK